MYSSGAGTYTFTWTAYSGGPFSYYKLVYETAASGKDPSYPGSHYWYVPGTGTTSVTLTVGISNGGASPFLPGDYQVRIQAIGEPYPYVYAQTTVRHLVVS